MKFSKQEYWNGLPFPSPEDLPDPGIEPRSPALHAHSFPSEPPGEFSPRKVAMTLLQTPLQPGWWPCSPPAALFPETVSPEEGLKSPLCFKEHTGWPAHSSAQLQSESGKALWMPAQGRQGGGLQPPEHTPSPYISRKLGRGRGVIPQQSCAGHVDGDPARPVRHGRDAVPSFPGGLLGRTSPCETRWQSVLWEEQAFLTGML